MKRLMTHLLAFALGVVAVILWSKITNHGESDNANQTQSEKGGMMIDGRPVDRSSVRSKNPGPTPGPSTDVEFSKSIRRADLEAWLESKKGNPRSQAEALVIAGLLTKDPDLVRQGIQADPENGHLLFIGATLPAFSDEERLAMSKRLLDAAPDNVLSSFISAAYRSEAGEKDAAIQILRESVGRPKIDDFRMKTQLMTEDALIAAGLAPDAAKVRSAFEMGVGYLSDLKSLVVALKGAEGSMSPDDASELRSMTALMGQHLRDPSRSGTLIDHLSGIALEEATLKGLPDEAPSPYDGLTVGQARESIAAERQSVTEIVKTMPDLQGILSSNPDLARRYVDYTRLMGELEAAKWLTNETKSGR